MVAIGELLASAIVKIAGDKLGSAIADQASLVWNDRKHMEDMKDTLQTIGATLQDAEKRSIKEAEVQLWLKRLKHAAYDISDMLDEFQDTSTQQMTGILPIAKRKIFQANKMKKMRERLRKIEAQHRSFKFEAQQEERERLIDQQDRRETTSDVNESDIIGRDADKVALKNMLRANHGEDQIMILSIYGLGGIGKSTLAGLVYNDIQFKEYDHRVWVYVSRVFDLKKIGTSIILQLSTGGQSQHNTDNLQLINRSLDDLLYQKKVLIVLDDLWEEDDSELGKLKNMLHRKGSTIDVILTTRNETIASKICSTEPFKLQPLKDDICWGIIKRSSQFEDKANKVRLEEIGLSIAKKCGGVALAAQSLGYMLKSKDLHGWSEINNSDIWNDKSFEVENPQHMKVLPSLQLSYEWMLPVQRLCFSFCAIFPKGHNIIEDDLIHQWAAMDFIKPSKGKEYIKQLLGMSFLKHSKLPSVCANHVVRYTMHDLVHDLARSVIDDELIVTDAARKSSTSDTKYCRYASLKNYDVQINLSNILPKRVRALLFSNNSKLDVPDASFSFAKCLRILPGASFSFAKCLRILDFSDCSGLLLPASISQLKQLRCLIAPRMQNEMLPGSIIELPKLQYLNLHGSSQISALPEKIGKLDSLIYLGLSGCSGITKLPESFGDLKRMVHLDMSGCAGIRELPDSLGNLTNLQRLELSSSSLKAIPESLCGLTQLQYLNLLGCQHLERLPEDIGNLIDLQYLNISCCSKIEILPKSFEKFRSLLHLDLKKCSIAEGLPRALCGLTSLQYLDVSCSSNGFGLSEALVNLTNLKFLGMRQCVGLGGHVDFIGSLTSLEHLDLSYNGLVCLPESIGNLKRLHKLDLTCCCTLKSLPESIREIRMMKSLLVEWCSDKVIDQANSRLHHALTLPLFKVRADGASDRSNLHQLEDINPLELNICCLENVRSLEEAHRTKLSDKRNLSKLTLYWTVDANRLVEDKDLLEQLVPPGGLESLTLNGYRSTGFPKWPLEISHYLPNLVNITLFNLPRCSSVPPLGQLPNLENLSLRVLPSIRKIDGDLCGGNSAFRRLSRFTLHTMMGLEEWDTTYSGEDGAAVFMFPMLDILLIRVCPRLRLKPCPPTFQEFKIFESDQVVSSLGEVDNMSHLSSAQRNKYLEVGHISCRSMRLLRNFPSLKKLRLWSCNDLTVLPESMRHLSSLQSLVLDDCDDMAALPEWLGDLSSLTKLRIIFCPRIESLPQCIQQLTKLRKLQIVGNSKLKKWCESEENKMKLAHIHDIGF